MESTGIKRVIVLCLSISVLMSLFFALSRFLSSVPDSGESTVRFFGGILSGESARVLKRELVQLYHKQLPYWLGGLSLLNLFLYAFLLRKSPEGRLSGSPAGRVLETFGILAFCTLIVLLAATEDVFMPGPLFSPLNEGPLLGLVIYFFVFHLFGQEVDSAGRALLTRVLLIDGIGVILILVRFQLVGVVLLIGNLLLFLLRSFRAPSVLVAVGYTGVLTGLFFDGWGVYRQNPFPIGFFILGLLLYLVFLFFELLRTLRAESSALKARIDSLHSEKTIQRLYLQDLEESARKDGEIIQKFEQLILTTNALFEKALLVKEDYLPELLEDARLLIPEADSGVLVLSENGHWRYHYAIGLDPTCLKSTPIDPLFFHRLKNHAATRFYDANVFLTSAISSHALSDSNQEWGLFCGDYPSLREALFTEITGEGSTLGYLLLFISEGNCKRFTATSFKVIGVLGSIASILLVSTLKKTENPNA